MIDHRFFYYKYIKLHNIEQIKVNIHVPCCVQLNMYKDLILEIKCQWIFFLYSCGQPKLLSYISMESGHATSILLFEMSSMISKYFCGRNSPPPDGLFVTTRISLNVRAIQKS